MLAKGDGKVYLITESLSAISSLGLNMLCFHLWGVDGLGYAYLAWYALYTIIVAVVYFGVYRLRLNFNCFTSLVVTLLVCTAMVVAVEHGAWIVAIPIFVVASSVSLFIAYRTWKR